MLRVKKNYALGGQEMKKKRDGRNDVVMTDVEALVPQEHVPRKIEKVMDYE